MPKIIDAHIGPMPRPMPAGMFDPMPMVTVTLDDGHTIELFQFYPDEIQFRAAEFVGLTVEQARRLKYERDLRYLQTNA